MPMDTGRAIRNAAFRSIAWALCALLVPWAVRAATPAYDYYAVGDLHAARPGPIEPGLLLMGGGDWPVESLQWFFARAGHGHIVVLSASDDGGLQKEMAEIGGTTAIETLVIHDRSAASDPRVLAVVRSADGIFFGGGDQANYVHFWQGTPLNEALDAHVRAGRPIGGTSAGLAILGGYAYGSLDGDSLRSAKALHDPLGPGVTLVRDFLHLPRLANVITDSHFAIRGRLGRLIVFVARLAHEEGNDAIAGLGVDEQAALCIDGTGIGRLYTNNGGYAWLVRPRRQAERIARGEELTFLSVPVTGIGTASTLDLNDLSVAAPAFHWLADARDGRVITRALP